MRKTLWLYNFSFHISSITCDSLLHLFVFCLCFYYKFILLIFFLTYSTSLVKKPLVIIGQHFPTWGARPLGGHFKLLGGGGGGVG